MAGLPIAASSSDGMPAFERPILHVLSERLRDANTHSAVLGVIK